MVRQSRNVNPPDSLVRDLQEILVSTTALKGGCGAIVQVSTPLWTWSAAAGKASLGPASHASPAMHFRVGSITKIFTATAICKLSEDKRMDLDDPIEIWLPAKYLDRIPFSKRITVRLLLNHRSGIGDYDEKLIPNLQKAQPTSPPGMEPAILQGLEKGPFYAPNTGYTYSNVNYLLLSLIIDSASGTSYERCIRDTIIDPLALANTSTPTDPPENRLPEPFMACLCEETDGSFTDNSVAYRTYDRGAADMVSIVEDLNTFHRGLREFKIINEASLARMEEFHAYPTYGYGLGYMRRRNDDSKITLVGHEGTYPGSWTWLYYWIEADTYIAANVNGAPLDVATPIISYLRRELW